MSIGPEEILHVRAARLSVGWGEDDDAGMDWEMISKGSSNYPDWYHGSGLRYE